MITKSLNKTLQRWGKNAYGIIGVTAYYPQTMYSGYYYFSPTKKDWIERRHVFGATTFTDSDGFGIAAFGMACQEYGASQNRYAFLDEFLIVFTPDSIVWRKFENIGAYEMLPTAVQLNEQVTDICPTTVYVYYITNTESTTKIYRVDKATSPEPHAFVCEVEGVYTKIAVNSHRWRFYLYNQNSNTAVCVYAFYPYTIERTLQFDANIVDSFAFDETQIFLLANNKLVFIDSENQILIHDLSNQITNPIAVSAVGTNVYVLSNPANITMTVLSYEDIFQNTIEEEQEIVYPDPEPEQLLTLPNINNVYCEITGLDVNQDTLRVSFGQYYIEGSVLAVSDTLFQIPSQGVLYFRNENNSVAVPVVIKITNMTARQEGDRYKYEINFVEDISMLYDIVKIESIKENWWMFYYTLLYNAGINITNWFNYTKGGELFTIKFEGERKKLLEELAKRTGCYVFRDYAFSFLTGVNAFKLVSPDELEAPYRQANGVIEKIQFDAGIDYNSIFAVNWLEDTKKLKQFEPIKNLVVLSKNTPSEFVSSNETIRYYYNSGYNYVGFCEFILNKDVYVPLTWQAYNSLTDASLQKIEVQYGNMSSECEIEGGMVENVWYTMRINASKNYTFNSFKYVNQSVSGFYSFLTNFNWNVSESITGIKIKNGFLVIKIAMHFMSDQYATATDSITMDVFETAFETLCSYNSNLFESVIHSAVYEYLNVRCNILTSTYEHPYMEYIEDGNAPVCFVEERFASGTKALKRLSYAKKTKDGSKISFDLSEERIVALPGEWLYINEINKRVFVDKIDYFKGFFVHKAFRHENAGNVFKTSTRELTEKITEKQFRKFLIVKMESNNVYVLKNNEVVSYPLDAGIVRGNVFVLIDEYVTSG